MVTISPGNFGSPRAKEMVKQDPKIRAMVETINVQMAFPQRMGEPDEYARLAQAIVENPMINGECIRLDGGMRLGPK